MPEPIETAAWVRVRLSAEAGLTDGELVLRADYSRISDEHVTFLVGDEVVYRLERRHFGAMTWFVDRPTFGEWLKARRKQYPNSHIRWSDDEVERLVREVELYGMDWRRIADLHGRTVSAVQKRAAAVTRA